MKYLLVLIVLVLCVIAAPASAVIVNVGGMSNGFLPQTVTVNVGDTVTFINKGGVHNVIADDGSFRCARGCDNDGQGGNGTATASSWIAKVTFNSKGTFGYYCEIHGQPGGGMFGSVIVQGPLPPPPPPEPIPAASGAALALLMLGILCCALGAGRVWRR